MSSNTMKDKIATVARQAIRDAFNEVLSDEDTWSAIDDVLQRDLDQSHCWLEFERSGVRTLVALGKEGDVVQTLKMGISIDSYAHVETAYPSQLEDLQDQLSGLDQFIAKLQERRDRLISEIQSDKWKALRE